MNQHRIDRIHQLLTQILSPSYLEICDDSAHHIGHAGAQGGGHFTVIIASSQFAGKNLIECHRLVYDALKDMMHSEIHALRIKIRRDPL